MTSQQIGATIEKIGFRPIKSMSIATSNTGARQHCNVRELRSTLNIQG